MTREIIFRPEAEQDVREAYRWYSQISRSLGEEFVDAVDDAALRAAETPLAFANYHRSLRRVLLKRFPYGLFFMVNEPRIIVVGVLHQARHPRVAKRRER